MTTIPNALRRLVYQRAAGKCEYCLLDEQYTIKCHHVDHIYAQKHNGETTENNLCLSCADCNLHKGSDFASFDPKTGEPAMLFHPRRNRWSDHFELDGATIRPLTPQGRATVRLLHMNDPERVLERAILSEFGRYP